MHDGIEKRRKHVTDEQLIDASIGPTSEWQSLSERLNLGNERAPEFGPLRLELATKTLHAKDSGRSMLLEPLEYQVLWILMRANGEEVPVTEIEEFLYRDRPDTERRPESNVVMVTLSKLRNALSLLGTQAHIPKRDGEGRGYARYRLVLGEAPVEEPSEESVANQPETR